MIEMLTTYYLAIQHLDYSRYVALERRRQASVNNRQRPFVSSSENERMKQEILGIRCEMATWLMMERKQPWHALVDNPTYLDPDIGTFISIKGIDNINHSLILKPKRTNPNHAYILVHENSRRYTTLGWIFGKDGMISSYWREDRPKPAFFIPQCNLRPMSELPPHDTGKPA